MDHDKAIVNFDDFRQQFNITYYSTKNEERRFPFTGTKKSKQNDVEKEKYGYRLLK